MDSASGRPSVLDAKYTEMEMLGKGNQHVVVYKAREKSSNRMVVIKLEKNNNNYNYNNSNRKKSLSPRHRDAFFSDPQMDRNEEHKEKKAGSALAASRTAAPPAAPPVSAAGVQERLSQEKQTPSISKKKRNHYTSNDAMVMRDVSIVQDTVSPTENRKKSPFHYTEENPAAASWSGLRKDDGGRGTPPSSPQEVGRASSAGDLGNSSIRSPPSLIDHEYDVLWKVSNQRCCLLTEASLKRRSSRRWSTPSIDGSHTSHPDNQGVETTMEGEFTPPLSVPFVMDYSPGCGYLVFPFIGSSVEELQRSASARRLPLLYVARLGIHLIETLETIHRAGYVHGDIHPRNIIFPETLLPDASNLHSVIFQSDRAVLVNFTHSSLYYRKERQPSPAKGSRAGKKQRTEDIASENPYFASIGAHCLRPPTRKDDMESLIYLLIYLTLGELPWFEAQSSSTRVDPLHHHTHQLKESASVQQICKNSSPEFVTLLNYIRSMTDDEVPSYLWCIAQLERIVLTFPPSSYMRMALNRGEPPLKKEVISQGKTAVVKSASSLGYRAPPSSATAENTASFHPSMPPLSPNHTAAPASMHSFLEAPANNEMEGVPHSLMKLASTHCQQACGGSEPPGNIVGESVPVKERTNALVTEPSAGRKAEWKGEKQHGHPISKGEEAPPLPQALNAKDCDPKRPYDDTSECGVCQAIDSTGSFIIHISDVA